MVYEVRKDGRTYMGTEHEACRYPPEIEASMQAAGYDIYIDGKRLPKYPHNSRVKTAGTIQKRRASK